jgi:hypothetical protein
MDLNDQLIIVQFFFLTKKLLVEWNGMLLYSPQGHAAFDNGEIRKNEGNVSGRIIQDCLYLTGLSV